MTEHGRNRRGEGNLLREDGSSRRPATARRLLVTAAALMLALALAGCSQDRPKASPTAPPPTPSPTTTTPVPVPPPPKVGSCHRLSLDQATSPTDSRPAVPCRGRHTSVTAYVGTYHPIVDGHLLAVDSEEVQAQLAKRCPAKLAGYVGGDAETLHLSRFKMVWFGPTVAQADAGAQWFRCDVVALAADDHLAGLGPDIKDVLANRSALDRYGTCATSAPDSKNFAHIICQRRHSWQAASTVDLTGAKYLGKAAQASAESTCTDLAASRAHGALKYTSGFEWPSRQAWDAGQRYGFCWVQS